MKGMLILHPPHADRPLDTLDKQMLIEIVLWQRDYIWEQRAKLEKAARRAGAHRRHLREMQRACQRYKLMLALAKPTVQLRAEVPLEQGGTLTWTQPERVCCEDED